LLLSRKKRSWIVFAGEIQGPLPEIFATKLIRLGYVLGSREGRKDSSMINGVKKVFIVDQHRLDVSDPESRSTIVGGKVPRLRKRKGAWKSFRRQKEK